MRGYRFPGERRPGRSAQGRGACVACSFAAVGWVRPSCLAWPSSRSRRSPRRRTASPCSTSASTTAASGSLTTRSAPSAGSPSRSASSTASSRRRPSSTSVDVWQDGPVVAAYDASGGRIYAGQRLRHRVLRRRGGDLARARTAIALGDDTLAVLSTDHSLRATHADRRRRQPVRAVRVRQAARRAPARRLRGRRRQPMTRSGWPAAGSCAAIPQGGQPHVSQRCRCRRPTRCRSPRSATSRWSADATTKTLYLPRQRAHRDAARLGHLGRRSSCSSRRARATSWSPPPARRCTA